MCNGGNVARILLLNGPNLNLLGMREPTIYGRDSLDKIVQGLENQAQGRGHTLDSFQSNAEHRLVERIHAASGAGVEFIIINPAALTHTSVALRDALSGVGIPFVEVHLSNIFAREAFRHHSYLSDIAAGVICGFGAQGYSLAMQYVLEQVSSSKN